MADEKEGVKEEGGKKKKTLIIAIVGGIVLLAVIGVAVWFLLLKGGEEGADATGGKSHGAEKPAKKKSHGDDLTMGPVFAIDNLVINLMSEGGTKYAKISLGLELDAQELAPEMLAKKALATDIVIAVISARTSEELMTMKGKETVKNEIMEKINERLKDGRVKNVYFTNFIVQ